MKDHPIYKGRQFEEKCLIHLKEIFDQVKWLSYENESSTFDFLCKKDGKSFYVEAKYRSKEASKPYLRANQKEADFLITNKGEGFEIIPKKDFIEKVYLMEPKKVLRVRKEIIKFIDKQKIGVEDREETLWRLFWQLGLDIPKEKGDVFDMKYIIANEYVKIREDRIKIWKVLNGEIPEYVLKLNKKEHKR